MTETVDPSEAYGRVQSLPPIELGQADMLARSHGLTISGPDDDGLVWADIFDPETRVRRGQLLGRAGDGAVEAWLAWAEGHARQAR